MKQKKTGALFAFFSFGMISLAVTDSAGEIVSDMREAIGSLITDTIIGGVTGIIDTFIAATTRELSNIISSMFGLLMVPIDALSNLLGTFFELVLTPLEGLFGVQLVAAQTGGTVPELPGIAWAIVGIALAGGGVTIVTATDVPIIGRVGGGVGSIFIISGVMIAVWGFFPDLSNWILGLIFIAVFMYSMYVYSQTVQSIISPDSSPN